MIEIPRVFDFQTSVETLRAHHWRSFIDAYSGCAFNCQYCLYKGPDDYGRHVKPTVGTAAADASLGILDIGTSTDPYQPIENGQLKTRSILEAALELKIPIFLLTRGTLVVRDEDVLQDLAREGLVEVCFSVITLNERLASKLEVRAPSPRSRLAAAAHLVDRSIPVTFHVAPVIPGLNSPAEMNQLGYELGSISGRHSQPDSAQVIAALGGPHQSDRERSVNQQVGPHRFDVTAMALDLPSYQRALACYLASVDHFFEIFNPTPALDLFIERHGPWAYTTPDVNTSGDPFQSPDPICYLPERLAKVAQRIPGDFKAFHQAWGEYQAEPTMLFAAVDGEQTRRDAAELLRRVQGYRHDRLRLASGTGVEAPISFRRLALDKSLGPRFATLGTLYDRAKARLPEDAWAYLAGGASGEQTLGDNEAAFGRWSLRPRQLAGVVDVDITTTFLDIELAAPLLTAPIGCDLLFHPDGQRAIVRAAAACGIAPVVAEASYCSLEAAASESDQPKLMQLHAWGSPDEFRSLTRRAEGAGFAAVCVTLDCPSLGWRERTRRIGLQVDERLFSGNHPDGKFAHHLLSGKGSDWTWDTLAKVATDLEVPLIVKGILTSEDTERAVEAGARGIIVSNHGGRQLDGTPATLDQLSEVVAAVRGRAAVAVDGGIRRGTDILKALALGADVVLVGRPVAMGLGAAGESGARQVLGLLIDEFRRSMLLAGCASIADINAGLIQPRRSA